MARAGAEAWRPLLTQYAGDIPVDALVAWIDEESGGNPCSLGMIENGVDIECGIFQLMSPDNTNDGGTTCAALRASCAGPASASQARGLTDDERILQVTSGLRYVQVQRAAARQALASVRATWPENSGDFWALVKSRHGAPAVASDLLPAVAAKLGHAPSNWSEFVNTYTTMSANEIPSSLRGYFQRPSRDGYRNRVDDIIMNADKVGKAVGYQLSAQPIVMPSGSGASKFLWSFAAAGAAIGAGWLALHLVRRARPMVLGDAQQLTRPQTKALCLAASRSSGLVSAGHDFLTNVSTLRALERRGLVKFVGKSGPYYAIRVQYRITDAGRAAAPSGCTP
jgi:hypothetical protein